MKTVVASFISAVILSIVLIFLMLYAKTAENDSVYIWFFALMFGVISFIFSLVIGLFSQFILKKLNLLHSWLAYIANGIVVAVVMSFITVWMPIIIGQNTIGWSHYWMTIIIFMATMISSVVFYLIIGRDLPVVVRD